GAWNPVQFETGPYVVAEEDGEVVAAAGTHFRYAALAQLGNVFTAPTHRGRGLARRVTAGVCEALVAMGTPTISLFVAEDNAPAWRVYESLGFTRRRMLDTFRWVPAD
ncbi:MAG: GNAT family N-acetyltransferase, partial [Candidatus Sericytochromatia bacterium]